MLLVLDLLYVIVVCFAVLAMVLGTGASNGAVSYGAATVVAATWGTPSTATHGVAGTDCEHLVKDLMMLVSRRLFAVVLGALRVLTRSSMMWWA